MRPAPLIVALGAALLVLAACHGKPAQVPAPSSQPAAPPPPAPPPDSGAPAFSDLPASSAQPAAAAPSADADLSAAQAVVRALYAPELTPFPTHPATDPDFTPELARALAADNHPGEVGAIDFDYRYGAQDVEITNLVYGPAQAAPAGARVTVRFSNIGKPTEVDYDLQRTGSGWRIADVSAPAQHGDAAWDLRALLKLPAAARTAAQPQ